MRATVRRVIVEVSPPPTAWRRAMPRAATLARKMAEAAIAGGLKKAPLRGVRTGQAPLEISIALASNAAVRRLNRIYRGKDKPTNVLSFPSGAPALGTHLLGDVVIAYGVTAAEAKTEDKALSAHFAHLVVHGVLHLLGYDHDREPDAVIMERLETDIMARMGFADPYAILSPVSSSRRSKPPANARPAARARARGSKHSP